MMRRGRGAGVEWSGSVISLGGNEAGERRAPSRCEGLILRSRPRNVNRGE